MKTTNSLLVFSLLALILSAAGGTVPDTATKTNFIDVHMHLVGDRPQGGPQRGPGPMGQNLKPGRRPGPGFKPGGMPRFVPTESTKKDYTGAAEALVVLMDKVGVQKVLILPPPQSPKNQGVQNHQDFLDAVKKYPNRLFFAAGGDELNPLIVATDPKSVTPKLRDDFKKRAEKIISDGAKAFGEMTALHFSLADSHVFEQVDPDHPLLLLLADIAAAKGVPIDLHVEAVPTDQNLPANLLGLSSSNPAQIKATIPGLERLLKHNRAANIVWQHIGWDNTGHMKPELLKRLLNEHPNLYMAIKILPNKSERPGININRPLDGADKIKPEWLNLLTAYPDRFVIGADEFVAGAAVWRPGKPSFETSWAFLKQLPPELRTKIGHDNAAGLYHLGP